MSRPSALRLFFLLTGIAISFPAAAAATDKLSLDAFLAMAKDKNLVLKVENAKLDAARAGARGYAIPPPIFGFTKMTDQSGSSAGGFEVSQMLPFPSKLAHDHSARLSDFEAQEQASSGKYAEILSQARLVYLNLWASQLRKGFMLQKKEVIQSHIKLARAGARSDSFLRIHLLKSETDLDLLDNEILAAEQEIREREAAAAEVLNADPASFHPLLEEPAISSLPVRSVGTSPQSEAARLGLESFKYRESEASSAWLPDFYFRYKTIGQTQLMPRTSEMMLGVSLPFIFPWEPAAASSKAAAQRMQSELEYEGTERKVGVEQSVLLTRATSLRQQLDNIQGKLLPRAEQRMKLVHNLAPRDMETLQDHRETMEAFPDLKLKSLDLRLRYEETIAALARFERGSE